MEDHTEDSTNITKKENNVTEIESALYQIASSLHSAAGAYMTLASCIHKLEPCKIPQVVAQIPPPPINVPVPIRKALTVDEEDKVVNHLQKLQLFQARRPFQDCLGHGPAKRHVIPWVLGRVSPLGPG